MRPWSLRDRGDTPRWGLMAGSAACCTQFFRCCPFSFLVQPQSTELPATTEGRWRRRHLSPGRKAGLLTVLLTCTGCAFQVTPALEKCVTLKKKGRPTQELAGTTPRTGSTTRTPLQSRFFKHPLWYPRAFRRIHVSSLSLDASSHCWAQPISTSIGQAP